MRRFEDILKDASKVDPRDLVREDRHRAITKIQRANIVEAEHMIDMAMRDQHGIYLSDICS